MKNLIIVTILLISTFGISQNNPAYKPIKVYFNDGSVLNGVGKIGNKLIKFKTHGENREIVKYTPDDIYGFDLLVERKVIKYRYRYLSNKNDKLILLVLAIQGKVSLYIDENHLNQLYQSRLDPGYNFYVGRESNSSVTFLSTNQGSSKGIEPTLEYFKDCPSLYAKIKSRFLRISEMPEIVENYNSECITE
ncbi:MAG: hypothetical protein R3342_13120 [Lutibacter sp.]|uniref:hypothetical protein n=1 Tax=Lutibacter sp. TaxID=1925666 RepID=UPI00299DACEC|nr:hypothetical protein [Lutibacter sp.]MDX1830474.1 hypothetical protein [Lutibacter sp.]